MSIPRQMTHPKTVEDCDFALSEVNRFLDHYEDESIDQFRVYIDMVLDLRLDLVRYCREFEL
jgi:hypothetical protein